MTIITPWHSPDSVTLSETLPTILSTAIHPRGSLKFYAPSHQCDVYFSGGAIQIIPNAVKQINWKTRQFWTSKTLRLKYAYWKNVSLQRLIGAMVRQAEHQVRWMERTTKSGIVGGEIYLSSVPLVIHIFWKYAYGFYAENLPIPPLYSEFTAQRVSDNI